MRDPVVAFRMPDADRLLVETEAERKGITMSEWIRRTIRDRLERERRQAPNRQVAGAHR